MRDITVQAGEEWASLPVTAEEQRRQILQAERDKISNADCAGKGDSYPISKPEDVAAAAHSLGRAGPGNYPPDKIKANIIAIARRKGAAFVAQLPEAWKGGGSP